MEISAKNIILNCINMYTALDAYQDQGVVHTWLSRVEKPHERKFSTRFLKPNMFQFEWLDPHPYPKLSHIVTKNVVGYDGSSAYSVLQRHEKDPIITIEENFELAIAGATGISGGAIQTIVQLLFPKMETFSILNWRDIEILEETELEGIPCYEVTGIHPKFGQSSVFIGMDDYLVRRISQVNCEYPTQETRLVQSLDVKLDPNDFRVPQ
jgi:hypothetical protein